MPAQIILFEIRFYFSINLFSVILQVKILLKLVFLSSSGNNVNAKLYTFI